MVKLILNGQEHEFEESAAQRILQVQSGCEKNGGVLPEKYELPEGSIYEFIDNGIRLKPVKGSSKKSKEQKADTESDNAL